MFDPQKYHPKWSLISYLVRTVRAKNRCERCGAANHQPHPVTGSMVYLTTAHLDRNRDNNRFWNLRALCQRCHLSHDRNQHNHARKYGRETQYLNGKLFEVAPLVQDGATIHSEAM
jgi:heterodisulfide reductase subunit B